MALSIQDRIQRGMAKLQKRLSSTMISVLGTKATRTFFLSIDQDKYKNEVIKILDYGPLECVISWPGNEIPMMLSTDTSDASTSAITPHLYDLLPIEIYINPYDIESKKIKRGDIIFYKVKNIDNSWIVIPLQLTDMIGYSTITNVVLLKWSASPTTSYELVNKPEYKQILQKFKDSDNW